MASTIMLQVREALQRGFVLSSLTSVFSERIGHSLLSCNSRIRSRAVSAISSGEE